MDANLVCASSFQPTGQQAMTRQTFLDVDMRNGFLPHALQRRAATPAVPAVADQAGGNSLRQHDTGHHRQVTPHDGVPAKLPSQALLHNDGAGKDDQAARLLVQSMHDP
jgi:hypothetical protein